MKDFPARAVPLQLGGHEPFEGPLDVLLALLDQQPERILSVPLSDLTAQYLAWLGSPASASLAHRIEFIGIATHLIRLKTLKLLEQQLGANSRTGDPVANGADSPVTTALQNLERELRARQQQLAEERRKFREVAEILRNDALVHEASLPRGRDITVAEQPCRRLSDLLVHIRSVRRQYATTEPSLPIEPEAVTEDQMYAWFSCEMEKHRRLEFTGMAARRHSRVEKCRLFSALLRGCKDGSWAVDQAEAFGPIVVTRL